LKFKRKLSNETLADCATTGFAGVPTCILSRHKKYRYVRVITGFTAVHYCP
jgi:hypothetical protein